MARIKREISQAEIAWKTARIRSGWSEREHRKRAGMVLQRWFPPLVAQIDIPDEDQAWSQILESY